MTPTPEAAAADRHDRSLRVLDVMTLALLAVGVALMVVTVRHIDLQIVLIAIACLMLGTSTVLSMHRRRTGYQPAKQSRPFGPGFLLRIAPSILILLATIITWVGGS